MSQIDCIDSLLNQRVYKNNKHLRLYNKNKNIIINNNYNKISYGSKDMILHNNIINSINKNLKRINYFNKI